MHLRGFRAGLACQGLHGHHTASRCALRPRRARATMALAGSLSRRTWLMRSRAGQAGRRGRRGPRRARGFCGVALPGAPAAAGRAQVRPAHLRARAVLPAAARVPAQVLHSPDVSHTKNRRAETCPCVCSCCAATAAAHMRVLLPGLSVMILRAQLHQPSRQAEYLITKVCHACFCVRHRHRIVCKAWHALTDTRLCFRSSAWRPASPLATQRSIYEITADH